MTEVEFAEFCARWYAVIRRYMSWRSNSPDDIDDLTQDVFTMMAVQRARINPQTATHYMRKTARLHVLTKWQQARRRPALLEDEILDKLNPFESPERSVCSALTVETALACLSDKERAVTELWLNGMPLIDIGREWKPEPMSDAYAGYLLRRALARVAWVLGV